MRMFERITRGWALTKQSWQTLRNDPSLMVFPLLSGIAVLISIAAIATPTLILDPQLLSDASDDSSTTDPVAYVAWIAATYLCTFIIIFFNVALAACAARSLRGEDTGVRDGIATALGRLPQILGWTLLAGTVGVVLNLLKDRGDGAGKIATSLVGAAWGVATFFVIPVIALEGDGPWRALKRSIAVVKERWGEGATGTAALSVLTYLLLVPAAIIGAVALGYSVAMAGTENELAALGGVVVLACAAVFLATLIVSSALSVVFRVAVYQYALTGEVATGFDGQALQAAVAG